MAMSPTMEDVARQAGVSKSTVSLALNDKPGISPELKQTVLRAAADLGYQLGKARSAPRLSTNHTIAVVHSEPDQKPLDNPEPTGLYLHYLNGIRAFAQTANVNLTVLADYREGDPRQLAFQLLQGGGNGQVQAFDGYILMGWSARQDHQLVQQIMRNSIPAVALSRYWPELPISTVGPNYRQQVDLAVEYLVRLGHRQIAFVGRENGERFDWHRLRLAAYRAAIRQFVGETAEPVVVLEPTGLAAAQTLRHRWPAITAIFAVNDDLAIEVLHGLQTLGCRVPQHISVIGQDNIAAFLQSDPALTTVGFPHTEVGHLAAQLLQQQIDTVALSYGNLWVRSYLVERASCAAPSSALVHA
jgi:DNA-binding LacI/PurR family transcriptional regulator